MKRKFIALALCMALVMSIAVPSTLAMGITSDSSDYDMAVEANAPEDAVLPDATPVVDNAESTPDAIEQPADEATTAQPDASATPEVSEPTPEAPAASAEPTPEVAAPVEPDASATPAADAEQSKEPTNTAAPAASEEPAATVELSSEQVTATYNALMAASTLEEMENILAPLSDDALNFLVSALTAEQIEQVNSKAAAFAAPESTPAPEESAQPDDSPIVYPTKNFTNAAPFLPPVEGTVPNAEDDRLLLDPVKPDNGVETSKTVSGPDENGQYTLTLEAWATGEKTIIDQETQVPTDIVLVLDQSGSMKWDMETAGGWTRYIGNECQNANLYRHRTNGGDKELYYRTEDGQYLQVSVNKTEAAIWQTYAPETTNKYYYNHSNNVYAKIGSEYTPVKIEYYFLFKKYKYTLSNGISFESSGRDASPDLKAHGVPDGTFYRKETSGPSTYTYSYIANGVSTEIGKSEGDTALFTSPALWHEAPAGTISRVDALKQALTTFTDSVKAKAMGPDGQPNTDDDVNHRIAMIGFASGNSKKSNYKNSELFVGEKQYNYNTLGLTGSHREMFKSAFQNMNETAGQKNVQRSVSVLDADGATNTHYGMEMAKAVLEENPVQSGEKRNRVVIVFTDGAPTTHTGFELKVANSAIDYAKQIKDMGMTSDGKGGTTVYSVGIFNGADATSAGEKPFWDLSNDYFPEDGTTTEGTNACNWFMQQLSSNNGMVQDPSYYLSAADSNALNNIFETISDNIETGGSSVQLGKETVMKDVISDYFQLPQKTTAQDIKVYTANCIGENTFAPKKSFTDAKVAISQDGRTVSVTNFDYSANWVGTVTENGKITYRGKKLIIEIPIAVRDGFLGGNDVPTNGAASGIYSNSSADKAIENFKIPSTDVEIPKLTVTAQDKNIYLNGKPTDAQLLEGATVQCGTETLDFIKPNYGLEPWQYAFVNVSNPTVSKNGTGKEDGTYTVTVTVTPKNTTGTATEKTGTANGNIHVFKPEIEYNDSTINYGEKAVYATQNMKLNNVVWKNGETVANPDDMIGAKPSLDYTYNPAEAAFKQNTDVCVTVKIGDEDVTSHVTFINNTDITNNTHQFTVYVKSYTLNIQKTANAPGVFKFHVTNNEGTVNMDVVIEVTDATKPAQPVTIKGLPQGTYTVTEDTNWSWNFTATTGSSQTVALTGNTRTGTASFVNTINDKWLNDSVCVKNFSGMHDTPNVEKP